MNEDQALFLGALLDNRPEEKRQKDFYLSEIVAGAAPVNWTNKAPTAWRSFPTQKQNGSYSCVAQTIKKLALISLWLRDNILIYFSATHIYQRRSNKPAGGMIGVEAFDIWMKGITLEQFAPSESLTDTQMDNTKIETYAEDIGKVFAIGGHIGLPNGDIDAVASVIQQTGKGVMVWFYFTESEWSRQTPIIEDNNLPSSGGKTIRHSVAAVDFTLYNGKKALIIEDSFPFGGLYQRVITEDFFKARNILSRYGMNFKFDSSLGQPTSSVPSFPKFTFYTPLVFIPLDEGGNITNMTLNNKQKVDVTALQDILKFEGLFPLNVSSTGYYGAMTAKAVLQWQIIHQVAPLNELNSLQGRRVGEQTIKILNSLYA